MKVVVIGLDCAAPEILFSHPGLKNIQRLMRQGCYGRLESVIPPITVPAWMCMSTSQDPGSLGVYGFRNRTDHSYSGLGIVSSGTIAAKAMWDVFNDNGYPAIVVGVPPNFPPRHMAGASVGCFLTPDTKTSDYTYPSGLKAEIEGLVGEYPVDVKGFRTDDKAWLLNQIYEMSRKHFKVVRHLMATRDWGYCHFVEIGLDRIHHGFWKYHDPEHRQHVPGSEFEEAVRNYYTYLDAEIGETLELIDDETVVLIVSDHGARRLDGGFRVNEWLVREGLLTLKKSELKDNPSVAGLIPFSPKLVDWEHTHVWSEGGYYARVFLNVQGREPQGTIPRAEYEHVRDDLKKRFEALPDDRGEPMGRLVFRPEQIYRYVRNVAPDLIVHFGALAWRSIGSLGPGSLYLQENDTGPDDCNHAQFGAFLLAGAGVAARGELEGARLLDIAPTLLDLANLPVPESMQGKRLSVADHRTIAV
ncbi:MAG: alkaline phosphatase family protein [Acidobacteriota bacterium]